MGRLVTLVPQSTDQALADVVGPKLGDNKFVGVIAEQATGDHAFVLLAAMADV